MDCRILRQLMLKSDGNLVCDDSNGYYITLGEVSTAAGWSIAQVLAGGVYGHVRRSFAEGRVPWPSVCETCDLFSRNGMPRDTLGSRVRVMVEPTLHCGLACPTCKRVQEAGRRAGGWTLEPERFAALLKSCAKERLAVEEIQYLGWGEPLLHPQFDRLTEVAREHAPAATQEVTTTGNVAFHDGLRAAKLDRVVISCDGVRQDTYQTFRRKGRLATVMQFMRDARAGFAARPWLEWKYIVFDHNDSDAEIAEAQTLAEELGVDSILFILTNSKNRSTRFDAAGIDEFPIRSPIASVMPAAAMMKTGWTGTVVAEDSSLGAGDKAMLHLDRCTVTESDIVVLEGWSLAADGGYVESIALLAGNRMRARVRTQHRRTDVARARPDAAGPDCGFLIRFPAGLMAPGTSPDATYVFLVTTAAGEQRFHARLRFERPA